MHPDSNEADRKLVEEFWNPTEVDVSKLGGKTLRYLKVFK